MWNIGEAGSTICLGLIFDMIIVRMFLVMPLARTARSVVLVSEVSGETASSG